MTLLHQAAQKAVEAVPRFRWDQDMDVLAGPYPDGEWVRRADVIAALQQQPEPVAPIGWVYDWTHSSALGKPDEQFTGFTTDEAHARKHDNPRAVYTAPALQHQEVPREPVAVARPLTSEEEENAWNSITEQGCSCCTAAVRLFCRLNGITLSDAVLAASPSTTRQQEVGSGAAFCPCSFCDSADACRELGCADAAYGREVAGRRAAGSGHTGDTERVRCVSCEWRGLVTDCAGFEQCDCPMCLAPVTDCPEAAPSTPENADGGPHG